MPVRDRLGAQYVQAVTQLLEQRQPRETQQAEGVPPVVQGPLVVEAHVRVGPVQLLLQLELLQVFERGLIGSTHEVVVAFDAGAVEIDLSRHAADPVVALEYRHAMAQLGKLVGSGKAHRSGADHGRPELRTVSHEGSCRTGAGRLLHGAGHADA